MFAKVFVVCVAIILGVRGASIPDYIKLCKRNDPNLNQCFLKVFNVALKHIGNGIPEMGLRKFEPVLIDQILIDQEGSGLALDADVTNIRIHGLTSGKATSVEINLREPSFKISMKIPKIFLESDYAARGKLLTLQIESKGSFTGNMTGISATVTWTADKKTKNGQTWLRNFNGQDLQVDIKHIKMHFENLIPNKEVNEEINRYINENIDILYKEIHPIIISSIKPVLFDAINSVHTAFPLETLYPE